VELPLPPARPLLQARPLFESGAAARRFRRSARAGERLAAATINAELNRIQK